MYADVVCCDTQHLDHDNIVKVGDSTFCIAYNQKIYSAFTVDHVETDLQRLIEVQYYVQVVLNG